jgi:hypothetical protein
MLQHLVMVVLVLLTQSLVLLWVKTQVVHTMLAVAVVAVGHLQALVALVVLAVVVQQALLERQTQVVVVVVVLQLSLLLAVLV